MASRDAPGNVRIEDLCLTARCYTALKGDGIDTVGQLMTRPERHLLGLANFTPKSMDELRGKLAELGLSPWDRPRSVQDRGGQAASRAASGAARPLSVWALRAAAALLLADERERWVEEWTGELQVLRSPAARARFVMSLLLAGGRRLAVTLRQVRPGHKPAWPPPPERFP
jgi:hypothetical protein